MEINITKFYNEAAPMNYSDNAAEIGANAGTVPSRLFRTESGEVYFSLD